MNRAIARILRLAAPLAVIAVLLPRAGLAEQSEDGLWRDAPGESVAGKAAASPEPSRFRALILDATLMGAALRSAPREDAARATSGSAAIVSIPLPDGGFGRFAIEDSPIMAPELAARFPGIRSYRGVGLDDARATVRLGINQQGFHAHVLSPSGTIYIDPDRVLGGNRYFSYFRRDAQGQTPARSCGFAEVNDLSDLRVLDSPAAPLASGAQLRGYRLALAATAEYTQFHGGTVSGALSAVVKTMDRVNHIYERELAIRMTLVANNDQIIFTNALTDPYSNADGVRMLAQNQSTLNSIIGNANYDIGHVFSTGGGGVASLGSVCRLFRKAQGVTGSSQPTGDPFDVDFVAHEMGHQFGATHTFNGTTSSCGGGNRSASTAYEPGSGTTIMSYAGICGAENIQPHSDAHFHGASFDQIIEYTTMDAGNGCASLSVTGNNAPVVDAGADTTIPAGTPFTLSGSAMDPDGDPLSYAWEQFDLGPASPPSLDDGSRPLFRSFLPMSNPDRTFPQWDDILAGTRTLGERLPSTTRELNFRLSAFDNRPGGGGVDSDAVVVQVTAAAGPFLVTTPNTAQSSWEPGALETVTWNVAGTDLPPVSCSSVDILLSTDGGTSFNDVLAAGVANNGLRSVNAPALETNLARVGVRCADNIFFDVSDANFSIGPGGGFEQADVNQDGCVDRIDLLIVFYGLVFRSTNPILDVNQDGRLGFDDVLAVAQGYTNPGGAPCDI